MLNLVMNLPGRLGNFEQPFIIDDRNRRELANGEPYDATVTALLFDGEIPQEAPLRYSDELKDLIRWCLGYRQDDRPTF
jgi:hypothetical protein